MVRDVISDEVWAVIGPLFPLPKATGSPPSGLPSSRRPRGGIGRVRRGETCRSGSGTGTRSTRTSTDGPSRASARLLEKVQSLTQQRGELDWVASIDSTIVRVHQHGATLSHDTGARSNYKKFGPEPPDHAIGRSRGGLTTKSHLVCDGRGRALAFVLTPGQAADTSMLVDTLGQIRVAGSAGRPGLRPDRVIADKGYPSRANRAWLRRHGIAATIPERDDQIAHRCMKPGRPIDFGDEQRQRYRGRNAVSYTKITDVTSERHPSSTAQRRPRRRTYASSGEFGPAFDWYCSDSKVWRAPGPAFEAA